jgi:hypothetical protein
MVYNSSIGLEAAIMGAAVLSGGKARYTQVLADTACPTDTARSTDTASPADTARPTDTKRPVVFFPQSQQAFQDQAEEFLRVKTIAVPAEFPKNARTFLYFQLYKSSISFEPFLTASPRAGFVHLKKFHWSQLLPENSPATQTLVNGILNRKPFLSYE